MISSSEMTKQSKALREGMLERRSTSGSCDTGRQGHIRSILGPVGVTSWLYIQYIDNR